MNKETIEIRASELRQLGRSLTDALDYSRVSELVNGTISLAKICYGPESSQCSGLITCRDALLGTFLNAHQRQRAAFQAIDFTNGLLATLLSELNDGLIGNLQQRIAGEVLGDLIELAKTVLEDHTPGTLNVAAVLIAASYEDTLRRMGTELAGISNKPKLEKVQNILKEKDLLRGSEVSALAGFLKFRNDALHADWDHIEKTTVHSCLSFVEQLLLKHFS